MRRFTSSFSFWMLACSMASILWAWPLHEARHIAEPVGSAVTTAASIAAPSLDDSGETDAPPHQSCPWCLSHAGHFVPYDAPALAFRFHAEASPPPLAPPCGLPAGRCTLAAEPCGPPRA